MKKIVIALSATAVLVLGGCSETFDYEAEPIDSDNNGKSPENVECFTIEADSSNGDDGDKQLGTFCKEDRAE